MVGPVMALGATVIGGSPIFSCALASDDFVLSAPPLFCFELLASVTTLYITWSVFGP